MIFKRAGKLREKMLLQRSKKQIARFGDTAANDDGLGVEQPAAVHDSGSEFLGDIVPNLQSNRVAIGSGSRQCSGSAIGDIFIDAICFIAIASIGCDFSSFAGA